MKFQRLNTFGEVVGKPTDKPTSRIGNNNERQVSVLYGHNGSGKAYNYLAGKSVRAGDIVTPMVTHPKSGKTYKTLAVVQSTRDSLGSAAGDTAAHLASNGTTIKHIGVTDQRSLPGFKQRQAQDPNYTAKQWAEDAQNDYDTSVMRRLNPMGETT